ncbi:MAG: hypothetical protein GX862_11405 [Leucobacter sp.]|jgi:LAS superfamily LD-carboxypeptidase LdcB|nr:hypothetical protein [Leucobacter sp.]
MALGKKKTISFVAIVAAIVVVTAATLVGFNLFANAQAHSAFNEARDSLDNAQAAFSAATTDQESAHAAAIEAHLTATALLNITDATLLADAASKTSLEASLTRLAEITSPPSPADEPAAPATPPSIPNADELDRAGLQGAAAEMNAQAVRVRAQLALITRATERVESARANVAQASARVIDAAHEHGTTAELPELASQETKDVYAAALAALAEPTAEADLAALMAAYQTSWAAVVASHAEATQALDPASIEPTYMRGILVVNKTYALPSWYGDGLTAETVAAFDRMQADAESLGLGLYISSGFRSYGAQESIYNRYVAADGRAEADRYSARPGHSEHQSGLTFDLNTIDEAFAYTAEGQWVRDNAHHYGFVIRYPQGKEHITGYIWEPWHLRYLGVDVATELFSSGLSLEEYLGITSQYAD